MPFCHSHTFCHTPTQRRKLFSTSDYTPWDLRICSDARLLVRTRWLKDSTEKGKGKKQPDRQREPDSQVDGVKREQDALQQIALQKGVASSLHIFTAASSEGEAEGTKTTTRFPWPVFSRMLRSKCYFLSKNKRIKVKEKRKHQHPSCKRSSVSSSQQGRALHLPRAHFDGGRLTRNKSI